MITKICTSDMTHEAWLAKRRESIGGSDAGALLGLNKYKSPYALWAEKTGKVVPEDISDKEAVRLGHDLEDYVAKRFAEATGKKVRRENHFIFNDLYPFAHALPDRMIVGESAGLECKTTSSWEIIAQCREGKYPDQWYAQVMHYMMVTGAKKWYLAVLCFGHGFYWFEIERSDNEIKALAEAESLFWRHVVND
ncbi:MAG: YqaJ viral recombinase family protein, partial [Ruminococcus sp.]|nr:YqaJ viral recombinase family protein [Ruminococcus sp.]